MRSPIRVGDTGLGDVVGRAERARCRFIGGDDDIDAFVGMALGELTQLRERFSEERSTGVAWPDDERGKLDRLRKNLERRRLTGGKILLHTP